MIHINLSGLAQPGQGLVFVYTDPDGLLGADAEVLVGLSDSASMQRVMLGGGAGRLPDVVAGGSGLPMTRLLFTEEERQVRVLGHGKFRMQFLGQAVCCKRTSQQWCPPHPLSCRR